MEMNSLLIVGGSKGVGRALALTAAKHGFNVTVTGRDSERLRSSFSDHSDISTLAFDVSDVTSIEAGLRDASFSHLAILAGGVRPGPLSDVDMGRVNALFQERVIGPTEVIRCVWRRGGLQSCVLTSGLGSVFPLPAAGAVFASALAAVEGMARGLAVELAPVRVNVVRLGWVVSDRHKDVPGGRDEFYRGLSERIPVGKIGTVEEAAEIYLNTLNQEYMSGHTIVFDGGLSVANR